MFSLTLGNFILKHGLFVCKWNSQEDVYIQQTHTCKDRTYYFTLCNFLFKNLSAMLLILAIFRLHISALSLPFPLSVLRRYFKSILKQNNILLRASCFTPPYIRGRIFSDVLLSSLCSWVDFENEGILFNQEQPLVWLGSLHTPSSSCDCEIFQKNFRVGHSTTKIFEKNKLFLSAKTIPNGSSHCMFTQHLQCLSAELPIVKSVLEVKTNNPRIPSFSVVIEDLCLPPKSRCKEPQPTAWRC